MKPKMNLYRESKVLIYLYVDNRRGNHVPHTLLLYSMGTNETMTPSQIHFCTK